MKIRNAYQYRLANQQLMDLVNAEKLTPKQYNEMYRLLEAIDTYELAHAEPRRR